MRREDAVRRAREESESERQEAYDQRMMDDYERRLEEGSVTTTTGPTLEELKRRVDLYSAALARSASQHIHPSTLEQFRKDYMRALDDYNRKKLGGK